LTKFKSKKAYYVASCGAKALIFKGGVYATEDKDEIEALRSDKNVEEIKEQKKK